MIKGGGGALLREKILATSSSEMVVIVDSSKWQERLMGMPLPIELAVFAYHTTLHRLEQAGFRGALRMEKERHYITDNGNLIFDMPIEIPIDDAANLHMRLKSLVGVVDTGLFFGVAGRVLVGFGDGRVEVR
jgi:ribose 5-phosphate isomerase A